MVKDHPDSGKEGKKVECPVCEGKKQIKYWRRGSDRDPHWVIQNCPKCKGIGEIAPSSKEPSDKRSKEECPICNGHGKIMVMRDDTASDWKQKKCPECDGTGKV